MAREANVHLQVLPGTDVAVALAMIRTAHEENLIDRAFVDRWTRGSDQLIGATCSADEAASVSGVSAENIRAVARALARSTAPFFRVGWGVERNRNGGNAAMAVLALPAVGGKFGVRGGGYSMSNSASWNIDRSWIDSSEPSTRQSRY